MNEVNGKNKKQIKLYRMEELKQFLLNIRENYENYTKEQKILH